MDGNTDELHATNYALASPLLGAGYIKDLQQMCPVNPVIVAADVHLDVNYALRSMLIYPAHSQEHALHQAFIQIILARTIPLFHLIDKSTVGSDDIIYQTVSYIAAHYTEELTLPKMAHDLGVSQSSLSDTFRRRNTAYRLMGTTPQAVSKGA